MEKRYTKEVEDKFVLSHAFGSSAPAFDVELSSASKILYAYGPAIERLAEYEDLGMTPPELKNYIKGLLEAVEKQKNDIRTINERVDRIMAHSLSLSLKEKKIE